MKISIRTHQGRVALVTGAASKMGIIGRRRAERKLIQRGANRAF